MTLRILVTGTQGQVARALVQCGYNSPHIEIVAFGRPELDLEKLESISAAVARSRPDLIVNAAAYTAVDKAETEPEKAYSINRDGAAAIAKSANQLGVPLIHLSTDYVYSGEKTEPYLESDGTGPLGVYGESKLSGEVAVVAACPGAIILRTAWIYSPFGNNFVKTMIRLGRERSVLKVVADQLGNPTSALDIARAILFMAPQVYGKSGVFHLAGTGSCSWYEFAREIFEQCKPYGGSWPKVEAITTSDYPTPAKRPSNSRLDTSAFKNTFGHSLPCWQTGLHETIGQLLGSQD
jgi:dTDP-4-dehydrorhamnose reductase